MSTRLERLARVELLLDEFEQAVLAAVQGDVEALKRANVLWNRLSLFMVKSLLAKEDKEPT